MTLPDAGWIERVEQDEDWRHAAFPVTARQTFMAHAGVSPLPAYVRDVICWATARSSEMQQETEYRESLSSARTAAAALLGVGAEEVALVGPTSVALSMVAAGLPWQPGDEVVFYPDDYPANVYPWRLLEKRGVRLVPLRPEKTGVITPALVAAALSPRTRLVALASAHYLSGARLDVVSVGRLVREAGALFCLDGIQTLGAVETPLDFVDFACADSHKWLLGPSAAGLLIVRPRGLEQLEPILVGAGNVVTRHFVASPELRWVESAARYECGSMNLLGIVGMRAGMELLLAAGGAAAIEKRLAHLLSVFLGTLTPGRFIFLTPMDTGPRTGILSLRPADGQDARKIATRLHSENIVVSCRQDREGTYWLRWSPHAYNTEHEMRLAAEILERG
jgi:selenocysteine lyase/cysteine desulfurase